MYKVLFLLNFKILLHLPSLKKNTPSVWKVIFYDIDYVIEFKVYIVYMFVFINIVFICKGS